jgi:decaprenylphospho-beta-D-ribofuranose 2-oxidase
MPLNKFLCGWGRYPVVEAQEEFPAARRGIPSVLSTPYLPRGQGRSYGDAGLPASGHVAVNASRLDHFLSFDRKTGILEAEGGVTLDRILQLCVPLGFFLPVTPGTRFVSLGGALASNVHGKNHHRSGSIEHFVLEMEIATPRGIFICSPDQFPELFRASLGGYGLTGLITRVRLKLRPIETAKVECRRLRAGNLDEVFRLFTENDAHYEYSVAWLDTLVTGRKLGRGILMLGNHAAAGGSRKPSPATFGEPPLGLLSHKGQRELRVPFALPAFVLNPGLLTQFNRAFYLFSKAGGPIQEGYESFFYPLDRILDWNLLYGKSGFLQYQCVIPDPHGEEGVLACLHFLSRNRLGAFLSVLKRCGADKVMLPFCKEGYTLALDIPFRGEGTLNSLNRLDEVVLKHGGRVYLTKDARLGPETFRNMYPEYTGWMEIVRRYNPDGMSSSHMAERLELWKGS